jgi:broad specificity phosphatase PhoE
MIYLVRHGETELNRQKVYQGHKDSSLTDRGEAQALSMGKRLRTILAGRPFQLHASPLGRTRQTAEIINREIGCPETAFDWRIAEIDIGDWSGLTADEIAAACPGAFDGPGQFDWGFRAPGGENRAAFLGRLQDWLSSAQEQGGIHVAVSHGWAGFGLRALCTGATMEAVGQVAPPQDAIFCLHRDQAWTV